MSTAVGAEDVAAEEQICSICGTPCESFVSIDIGGDDDLCESCADIATEEYSL